MSGISNTVNLNVDGTITGTAKALPAAVAVANAAYAVTTANTGNVFMVAQATNARVITLPAVAGAAGCIFKFVWTGAGDNTAGHTWSITAPAGTLNGTITNNVAGAAVAVSYAGATSVVRTGTAANTSAGDWCELYCDGTNYYVCGQGTCGPAGAGGATFA